MKRILALTLALLTVILCFAACDNGGEIESPEVTDQTNDTASGDVPAEAPAATEAPAVTDEPATEAPATEAPKTEAPVITETEVVICENGVSNFEVIYYSKASAEIKAQAKSIGEAISALGGKVKVASDWAKELSDTSADYEILVGLSSRPESAEVLDTIDYDDYAIKFVRNKIVIVAHTPERMTEAVASFLTRLSSGVKDGKNVVSFKGEEHYVGAKKYFFGKDNPLDNYRIVCATSSAAIANARALADAIKNVYGVDIKVGTDKNATGEYEIVVGYNKSAISQKYINTNEKYEYVIKTEGKSLLIGAYTDAATAYAIDNFVNAYVDRNFGSIPMLEENCDIRENIGSFEHSAELTEGADLRIISFNVLFNNTYKEPTPAERSICLGAMLEYFSPDVIGLQEMNEPWHEAFAALDSGYKILDADVGLKNVNNSCIAYNPEKVKVLDHGYQIYSKGDRPHLRLASWAYFEDISSGKKFVLLNTHWDIVADYQMIQAEEMANLAVQLQNKYNCAVITTGDYNRVESTAEYKKYVEITKFQNSKYTAAVKGHVHKTGHGFNPPGVMPNVNDVESIDHIFGNDKVEFLYFSVFVDQIVLDNSDHCPVFADIKLK